MHDCPLSVHWGIILEVGVVVEGSSWNILVTVLVVEDEFVKGPKAVLVENDDNVVVLVEKEVVG